MPSDASLTAFVLAMVFVLYVMYPALALVHELGHALAVIRTGRRPVIVIGKTPPLFVRRFKSLDIYFHPRLAVEHFYPRTPPDEIPRVPVGGCGYDLTGLTVRQLRSIHSAGPHASIIAGLLLGAVALLSTAGSIAFWISALSALEAFIEGFGNLIPRSDEGRFFSDGAKMARLRGLDDDFVPAPKATPRPGLSSGS